MSDKEFQKSAFPVLAREISETVRARRGGGEGAVIPVLPLAYCDVPMLAYSAGKACGPVKNIHDLDLRPAP